MGIGGTGEALRVVQRISDLAHRRTQQEGPTHAPPPRPIPARPLSIIVGGLGPPSALVTNDLDLSTIPTPPITSASPSSYALSLEP